MVEHLLAFAGLCVVLAVTPGPDLFLVLRTAIRSGTRPGLTAGAGAAFGSVVWAGAAGVGLAAVLTQFGAAYTVLRVLGALYLLYLGITALWQSWRRSDTPGNTPAGHVTPWQAGRAGFTSAVLNPKIGLFFLAVAPQFVPPDAPVAAMTLLLGGIDAVVAMAWLGIVAVAASRVMRWLARPRVAVWLERVTGLTLTGLGAVTLATTRPPSP